MNTEREIDRQVKQAQRDFTTMVIQGLTALGRPAVLSTRRDKAGLYRRGGGIGCFMLVPYMRPHFRGWAEDQEAPLVYRAHLNHYQATIPRRALAELGFPPGPGVYVRNEDGTLAKVPVRDWLATPTRIWVHPPDEAPTHHPVDCRMGKFEFTFAPGELAAVGPWLAAWLDARERGVPHPPCPVEVEGGAGSNAQDPGDLYSYVWTQTALDLYYPWQRMAEARRKEREARRTTARAV